jgi:phosphate transport system substrate-binding protein
MMNMMNISLPRLIGLLVIVSPTFAFATEVIGAGSMIPVPLMKAWSDVYTSRNPGFLLKYQGSNPAEGIRRIVNKEVDFSSIDMPFKLEELNKNGLLQFPFALGAIAPIVNLPNVYPGQFRLDGKTLGDIFLGKITKWNDPVISALNPKIRLPDENIVIVHRVASPGVRTIIGDFLAKNNTQWKSTNGDSMGGNWPATAIEVKDAVENFATIKKTQYCIGYGAISLAMKQGLSYVQLKNQAGNFVSPSDENVSAAAVNAKWDESNGFNVVMTDQPGATSWPMSFASFVLVRKQSADPERSREMLKYFKYSLRYGGLKAVEYDYTPLPEEVTSIVRASWNNIVDEKGQPVFKD